MSDHIYSSDDYPDLQYDREGPYSNDVGDADACPHCGERDCDYLVWRDDETVQCSTCGHDYRPDMPMDSTGTAPGSSGS